MLWVADEVAQLPSLLVQLIDDITPPLFSCKKGFGVYLLVFVPRAFLLHGGLGWEVMERMCMIRGRSEEWLMGPPKGASPRCATDEVPSGISSGAALTSEIRARDSESYFHLKSGASPFVCDRSLLS